MERMRRQFASDNYSGICPEAFEALTRANAGHSIPYGEDEYTSRACNMMRDFFETDCDVFFVFNGTAANSLALASLCQSYHSIICQRLAHIETDECGAPEFFSNGTKILLAGGPGRQAFTQRARRGCPEEDGYPLSQTKGYQHHPGHRGGYGL